MNKVFLIDKCENCPFYREYDVACIHPKMQKANDYVHLVYLSWYMDKKDADGFPVDCPFPTEQEYLDAKIKNNISKAGNEM